MHGYHPDDPYSDAVFLSNRRPAAPLATIRDFYGHMEKSAGISTGQLVP
jgi:hypothetical protein